MQPLTDVERIGCRSCKLGSEPAQKRKHLLSDSVDVHDVRQVNDQLYVVSVASYQDAGVCSAWSPVNRPSSFTFKAPAESRSSIRNITPPDLWENRSSPASAFDKKQQGSKGSRAATPCRSTKKKVF
jgi:hypothetical protein